MFYTFSELGQIKSVKSNLPKKIVGVLIAHWKDKNKLDYFRDPKLSAMSRILKLLLL